MKRGVRIKGILPSKSNKSCSRKRRKNDTFKDKMANSKLLYPCNFCTRVFSTKKKRTAHVKSCSAKDYIISIDRSVSKEQISPPRKKIEIHQNIIIERNANFTVDNGQSSLKLTIQRKNNTNEFLVINPAAVLKEKNETAFVSNESNANLPPASLLKTEDVKAQQAKADSDAFCQQCDQQFGTSLELLRHSRTIHSYPRIMMVLSEVQKYYSIKDRSKCPICHKPLRTNFKSAFIKHLHTHTTEALYSCVVCNKKFGRMDHMKAHEKRHVASKNLN